jgi:hypothetical protein
MTLTPMQELLLDLGFAIDDKSTPFQTFLDKEEKVISLAYEAGWADSVLDAEDCIVHAQTIGTSQTRTGIEYYQQTYKNGQETN